MLQNNLDPQVAFDPDNLIVYGGRGRAARNWAAFDAILNALIDNIDLRMLGEELGHVMQRMA